MPKRLLDLGGIAYECLPTSFNKRGRPHTLVKRNQRFAIYELQEPSGAYFYEVIQIQFTTDPTPKEVYPTKWGLHGWSFPNRLAADHKYFQLSKILTDEQKTE